MSPETSALLTLGGLAAAAVAILAGQVVRCGSVSIWLVSKATRAFTCWQFSLRVHGPCPLPVEGGALVVANHRSPVDPILLYSASLMKNDGYAMRPIEFLTAREYCRLGGPMGWVTRTARVIPVERDGKDMAPAKEALRRLQAGRIVGIFPEGGINDGPHLFREFNPGVAWLALRGNVPVIPAYIRNTPYVENLMLSFLVAQPADVLFGPPIDLSRWTGQRPTQELLQEVTAHMHDQLTRLAEEPWPAWFRRGTAFRPRRPV